MRPSRTEIAPPPGTSRNSGISAIGNHRACARKKVPVARTFRRLSFSTSRMLGDLERLHDEGEGREDTDLEVVGPHRQGVGSQESTTRNAAEAGRHRPLHRHQAEATADLLVRQRRPGPKPLGRLQRHCACAPYYSSTWRIDNAISRIPLRNSRPACWTQVAFSSKIGRRVAVDSSSLNAI